MTPRFRQHAHFLIIQTRLFHLGRELTRLRARRRKSILSLEAVPKRDPSTGTFTAAATITGENLRAAWGLPRRSTARGSAFKSQLLAALRAPRK